LFIGHGHAPQLRQICAASFAERVLHHAVMNICEPVLERYAVFKYHLGNRAVIMHYQEYCFFSAG
jgi:hypothetical protein